MLIFTAPVIGRIASGTDRAERSQHCGAALEPVAESRRSLDGFRSGRVKLLSPRDLAARGPDVESISHVSYDIPDTADPTSTASSDGSGSADRQGADAGDRRRSQHGPDIERALGEPITVRQMEGFDYSGVARVVEGWASSAATSWSSRSLSEPGVNRSWAADESPALVRAPQPTGKTGASHFGTGALLVLPVGQFFAVSLGQGAVSPGAVQLCKKSGPLWAI